MKKLILPILFLFNIHFAISQTPQKMSYQSVLRYPNNSLVISQTVGMRISLLKGNVNGTAVYIETHTPSTNTNGLISIEVGGGTVVSGNFSTIDWGSDTYFIKTETDPTGGTNYSIIGTSQFLSVPYAFHSKTSDNGNKPGTAIGEMQYWNGTIWTKISPGNNGEVLIFADGKPVWGQSPNLRVGDPHQGGVIAYILKDGDFGYDPKVQHGIIASPTDLGFASWGCTGTSITGSDSTSLASGRQNTLDIIAGCSTPNIAAKLCQDLNINGYDDWYLPSKDELNVLYLNRFEIGGFSGHYYWSSSEVTSRIVWTQAFNYGYQIDYYNDKSDSFKVRAIRNF